MRVLLDSHVVLWTLYDPTALPLEVKEILSDSANELLISHVSALEIMNKVGRSGIPITGNSTDDVLRDVLNLDATMVPIELRDIQAAANLPWHHADPMDRLLIAQARRLDAVLLSKDGSFDAYDVAIFWKRLKAR